MPDYMVFRAVVPPGFNLEEYEKRSSEPIRYDAVTVIEAENANEAVNTLIGATGFVSTGFAAIECELVTFTANRKGALAEGGKLVSKPVQENKAKQLEAENDARYAKLKNEIDQIEKLKD